MSKVSGTNVSYQSNLSAIRLNIYKFKNKQKDKKEGINVHKIRAAKNSIGPNISGIQIPRKGSKSPSKVNCAQISLKTTKINLADVN